MKYEVEVANSFKKNFKKLLKRYHNICDDLETLIANLEIDPYIGADLGNGIRNIRMAISDKGKGKSHGARVITFTVEMNEDQRHGHIAFHL